MAIAIVLAIGVIMPLIVGCNVRQREAIMGGEEGEGGQVVAKTGFAGFMYLERLDASFSFDGVIGAFALTNSLPIIAIGLGVATRSYRCRAAALSSAVSQ